MKKIVLRSALLLSIISPILATTTTLSVNAETSLRVQQSLVPIILTKDFL
ncbi:hypothetical protein ACTMS8_00925 [Streptococcus suis]|nr:hypothetical protein [Streptococcus suis]NQO43261.1 hypothetical protein [Streptococcus suis]NQO54070.1 hypothetical protein [Streptococcus suis]NQP52649.1 hypothetical protein [Streptococcus suis]HEL1626100.1 hypothetical protein [Streptococcus suis]